MKTQKRQRPATTPPPLNFLHRTVSTDDSLEEETLPPSPGSQSAISLSSFRTVTRNGEPTSSDVYNMFQQILRMGSIEARLKATEDHAEALENFKKKQEDQIIALEEKCKELTLENIELSRLVASQKDEQIDRTKRLEKLENEVIPSVESRITSNTQLQIQQTVDQTTLISRSNEHYETLSREAITFRAQLTNSEQKYNRIQQDVSLIQTKIEVLETKAKDHKHEYIDNVTYVRIGGKSGWDQNPVASRRNTTSPRPKI